MPRYREAELERIFDRTDGRCHLCYGRLVFEKYGDRCNSGGWTVDHSVAKANGGTDHPNNLYPCHWDCNRQKSDTRSARECRDELGYNGPPLSSDDVERQKVLASRALACLGATGGFAIGGPLGLGVGVVAGAFLGRLRDPNRGRKREPLF